MMNPILLIITRVQCISPKRLQVNGGLLTGALIPSSRTFCFLLLTAYGAVQCKQMWLYISLWIDTSYQALQDGHFTCFIRTNIAIRGNKKAASNGSGFFYKSIFYLPNNFAIAVPSSAGESTTVIPQSRKIAFLAAAVSSAPPTIAPA